MIRKPALVLLISILFLPASCVCGLVAQEMRGARQGMDVDIAGPLWLENLLWLGALALMILWARQIQRLNQRDADNAGQPETTE